MKHIQWQEIETAHVRNYNPIGEYGGWGIKGGLLWNKEKGKYFWSYRYSTCIKEWKKIINWYPKKRRGKQCFKKLSKKDLWQLLKATTCCI
jgi:hypothetical protein